jgi:hypothetical protein
MPKPSTVHVRVSAPVLRLLDEAVERERAAIASVSSLDPERTANRSTVIASILAKHLRANARSEAA